MTIAVAAALLGAAAPAFAQSQLIASAGLTPAEAAGLSLNEIAVAKFNREADSGDRQPAFSKGSNGDASQLAASAGLGVSEARGLSLTEIAAVKFNRDAPGDDRQRVRRGGDVTVISRSVGSGAYAQLLASAGLTPGEARGLSLSAIAAAKFDRDSDS
jgi:hypothetical protein